MSKELIRERILSDAQKEAEDILKNAEEKATAIIAAAELRAQKEKDETEKEVKEKSDSVYEKRAAAARLESSKILLAQKRNVIDSVYAFALERLVSLDKEQVVALSERLLEKFAEDGDEIFFAENFKYAKEVALLPVVNERNLIVSKDRVKIDGGFVLKGKKADKDLSYGALLKADRDEYQAELAREIF
jgi:V/A-type H+-transporting ATPase subunit E